MDSDVATAQQQEMKGYHVNSSILGDSKGRQLGTLLDWYRECLFETKVILKNVSVPFVSFSFSKATAIHVEFFQRQSSAILHLACVLLYFNDCLEVIWFSRMSARQVDLVLTISPRLQQLVFCFGLKKEKKKKIHQKENLKRSLLLVDFNNCTKSKNNKRCRERKLSITVTCVKNIWVSFCGTVVLFHDLLVHPDGKKLTIITAIFLNLNI